MSAEDQFEAFMQKVLQRPLSDNPLSRIRVLAKELAEGATEKFWTYQIYYSEVQEPRKMRVDEVGMWIDDGPSDKRTNLTNYVERRWGFASLPELVLLAANDYATEIRDDFLKSLQGIQLIRSAFDLLREDEFSTIFISYKRTESSAFALLVNTRLKAEGLNSYLDLAIPAGDDWQQRIRGEIEKHDYFVLLLGEQTLSSSVVLQELTWAIQFGKIIIPVWHNNYEYKSGVFPLLLDVDEVLKKANAIRVLEESALAYNNAIVELLNRFGITP